MTDLKSILMLYRDPKLAKRITKKIHEIAKEINDYILIMHVCGTHEWTITHYGIRSLMPENVELRAGPGCPVCITPASDIDAMVNLSLNGIIVTAYGDISRAKGSKGISLEDAKSMGGNVKIVYSVQDAFMLSKKLNNKDVVFFGIGFDTTAPATAYMIKKDFIKNLSILSSYRYVPPAVGALLEAPDLAIDGVINPGHSSTVTGMKPYKEYFDKHKKPMVFSGFEPIDVLISIYLILKQIREGKAEMINEYTRSVTWEGNVKAMRMLLEVFRLEEGYWRGFGIVDNSAFEFKEEFDFINARVRYGIKKPTVRGEFVEGAKCSDVIKGKMDPIECPLYMKECTPSNPKGPSMVSVEGTCRIWAEHKVTAILKCRI